MRAWGHCTRFRARSATALESREPKRFGAYCPRCRLQTQTLRLGSQIDRLHIGSTGEGRERTRRQVGGHSVVDRVATGNMPTRRLDGPDHRLLYVRCVVGRGLQRAEGALANEFLGARELPPGAGCISAERALLPLGQPSLQACSERGAEGGGNHRLPAQYDNHSHPTRRGVLKRRRKSSRVETVRCRQRWSALRLEMRRRQLSQARERQQSKCNTTAQQPRAPARAYPARPVLCHVEAEVKRPAANLEHTAPVWAEPTAP